MIWPHSGPTHGGPAHWFAMPPAPQVSPEGHVPQSAVTPPQPSATTPHIAPASEHVRFVHTPLPLPASPELPHWKWTPLPPQVSPVGQLPQSIVPVQPSPIRPHIACSDAQVLSPQLLLPSVVFESVIGVSAVVESPVASPGCPLFLWPHESPAMERAAMARHRTVEHVILRSPASLRAPSSHAAATGHSTDQDIATPVLTEARSVSATCTCTCTCT